MHFHSFPVIALVFLFGIITATHSDAPRTNTKEFRAQKVGITFERGDSCRNRRQDSEYCEIWASGKSSFDSNGLTAVYSFTTTDNINASPINVEGVLSALFMENITDTKCSVSGMLQAVNPSWVVEPFEGLSDRPIRLYQRRQWEGNILHYEWLEITVSGAYDPQWINSRELRLQYDEAKKPKQSSNKEL